MSGMQVGDQTRRSRIGFKMLGVRAYLSAGRWDPGYAIAGAARGIAERPALRANRIGRPRFIWNFAYPVWEVAANVLFGS